MTSHPIPPNFSQRFERFRKITSVWSGGDFYPPVPPVAPPLGTYERKLFLNFKRGVVGFIPCIECLDHYCFYVVLIGWILIDKPLEEQCQQEYALCWWLLVLGTLWCEADRVPKLVLVRNMQTYVFTVTNT